MGGGSEINIGKELARNRYIYLLGLPGLLTLIVFSYVPMFGHLIAFQKFTYFGGIFGSEWVGFANFKFFFMGNDWIKVTANTLFLNALFIGAGLIVSVTLAVFLNEIRLVAFKRVAQSLMFMPFFVSWVVVSMMVFALLNTTSGLINRELARWGLEAVSWYSRPELWPAILTLITLWKSAGYSSVIYLAAIAGISPDYYESADMDGASRIQKMFYITVPLLTPYMIVLTLLAIGRIFYGDFGMIYGIVGDNSVLFPTTDVIDTYTYRALRLLGNFSMSSTIALYQSALGFVAILLSNWVVKRVDKDAGLF